jgi:hypothetical protein
VDCTPNLEGATMRCATHSEREIRQGSCDRVDDRRRAVSFLAAAARTDDASERGSLRRQAAKLILPPASRCQRLL